jgi:hypothetical protein
MSDPARRPSSPLPWLLLVVLAAAVVTPLGIEISEPVVHGWADTVGFTAGVLAACVAIRVVLQRLGAATQDG